MAAASGFASAQIQAFF